MTIQTERDEDSQITLNEFNQSNTPSQVGEFEVTLPESLKDEVKNTLYRVQKAVQDLWGEDVLKAAVSEFDGDYGLVTGGPDALSVFAHLVWLQDLGLLPGYPRYTRTIDDAATPLPIAEFCSSHPDIEGQVTAEALETFPAIERNRLYRSKIYSVTKQFWVRSSHVLGINPWIWKTYSSSDFDPNQYAIETDDIGLDTYHLGYDESEFATTAIFDDSGAHNVAVYETRNWIQNHPAVEASTVPYVVDAPDGIVEIEGIAPTTTSKSPYWMFDIGIISNGNVVALGSIIEGESAKEILDQLRRIHRTAGAALMVFPSRQAIHQFLATGAANNWFASEIAPTSDVVDHYKRQPSLRHVNKELWARTQTLRRTVFLSRKQILDEFVDPHEIFPAEFFASEQ